MEISVSRSTVRLPSVNPSSSPPSSGLSPSRLNRARSKPSGASSKPQENPEVFTVPFRATSFKAAQLAWSATTAS